MEPDAGISPQEAKIKALKLHIKNRRMTAINNLEKRGLTQEWMKKMSHELSVPTQWERDFSPETMQAAQKLIERARPDTDTAYRRLLGLERGQPPDVYWAANQIIGAEMVKRNPQKTNLLISGYEVVPIEEAAGTDTYVLSREASYLLSRIAIDSGLRR